MGVLGGGGADSERGKGDVGQSGVARRGGGEAGVVFEVADERVLMVVIHVVYDSGFGDRVGGGSHGERELLQRLLR